MERLTTTDMSKERESATDGLDSGCTSLRAKLESGMHFESAEAVDKRVLLRGGGLSGRLR